jgi:WD40-like Beta Propeller Repeat
MFCAADNDNLADRQGGLVTSRRARVAGILALAMFSILASLHWHTKSALASPQQIGPSQGPWNTAGFQGAWCAQGDRNKHCSIGVNGPFLTLTNENGDTSTGNFGGMGQNTITAVQWNFVQGTLSPDGSRINWTNGTYWTRCQGGGGGGHRPPNLDGTWYRDGKRSRACSIRQNKRNLRLRNESGQTATGTIDGNSHVTTNWSGNQIAGTISKDGNTIYWNNGTSWSR